MKQTANMKIFEKYKAKTLKLDEQKKARAEEINFYYDAEIENADEADAEFLEELRKADLKELDEEFAGKKAEIKASLTKSC